MAEYDRITHRLQADNCVRIGFTDPGDEFILLAGHVERRPVEAFALPVRRQTRDNDDGVRLGGEFLRSNKGFLWINLLASSESLRLPVSGETVPSTEEGTYHSSH